MASQSTAEPPLAPPVTIPFHPGTLEVSSGPNGGYVSSCTNKATLPQVTSSSTGVWTSMHLSHLSHLGALHPSGYSSGECSHPSIEHSTYLTPSLSRGDYDIPSYKSHSQSSGSLNTTEYNVDILSQGKPMRESKKHGIRSKNTHPPKADNMKESYSFSSTRGSEAISATIVDPDNTCDGHRILCGTGVPAMSSTRSCEGHLIRKKSTLALPIISRRWSSVGIDNLRRPTYLRYTEPAEKGQLYKGDRIRAWTLGQEAEFIQAVRSRLTSRKVSVKQVDTPATITLRRASGTTGRKEGGNYTPVPLQIGEVEQQPPVYLITSGDVDSVLGLIQSRFQKYSNKKSSSIMPGLRTEHNLLGGNDRRLSVTSGGVYPQPSVPANPTTTVTGVVWTSEAAHMSLVELGSLGLEEGESRSTSGAFPRKSISEVDWEGDPSRRSICTSKAPLTSSAIPETISESASVPSLGNTTTSDAQEIPAFLKESSNQIRNNEEVPSPWPIFRTVWNVSAGKDTSGLASAIPQSSTIPIAGAETSTTEYNPLGSDLPDVFSFPPLPSRKFTSDWISPLPDITRPVSPMLQITEPPLQSGGGSLYDSGIDARTGQSHSGMAAPNKMARSPKLSPSNSSGSRAPHQSSTPKPPGRRSLALPQQETAPRAGHLLTLGHAIGVSSGARRKSSTQSNHIHIAQALPHCHHGSEPWIKPRKDSGWPTRMSPSPEELDTRRSSQNAPLITKRSGIDKGQTDVEMDVD